MNESSNSRRKEQYWSKELSGFRRRYRFVHHFRTSGARGFHRISLVSKRRSNMPPSPPALPCLTPLTSFFRNLGLLRRNAPLIVEIDGGPIAEPIGDFWQAEKATIAFEEGKLRSLILEDNTIEDDDSNKDDTTNNERDSAVESADSDSDSDIYSEDLNNSMAIIFRNESPATLLLCWVSETGEPYHFYRLLPSSVKSKPETEGQGLFQLLENDHLENTFPGHAFCFGYVQNEEEIVRAQKSKSLFRRERGQFGTASDGKRNNDDFDDCKNTNASCIVVAGYRPFGVESSSLSSSSSSASSSSSVSLLSRRVQLVTISHVPPEEGHAGCDSGKKKRIHCLRIQPWCLEGRKRSFRDSDNDSESSDDNNISSSAKTMLDPRGWRISARWVRTESKPLDSTMKVYEECTLGGWPCRLEPNWSNGDETSAQKLERDIRAASMLLPPHARAYLRQHCKIWVNRSMSWGPSDCPVRGHGCCYHPGKEWLAKNGLSEDKHMCVEVNDAPNYKDDCDLWGIGGVMLHELSHAYHHGMLPGGYENQEIQRCYELAMQEGLYDSIEYHSDCSSDGKTMRRSTAKAYACNNAMEYFAELSAAFLGGLDDTKEYNKWYPFNRKQLQSHDPRAYAMLSRLWKVNLNVAGKTTTN